MAVLLTLCMVLSMVPATAFAGGTGETSVDLSQDSFVIDTNGSYVVDGYNGSNALTIKSNATVTLNNVVIETTESAISIESGNVILKIEGENTLTGGDNFAGIYVAEGASVTIQGSGKLTAIGNDGVDDESGAAGIGGTWSNGNSGAITIDGATVVAKGYGKHGSGIGSGSGKVVGEIQIVNGANVTAYGGYCDYADEGASTNDMWAKKDPEGSAAIGGGGKTGSTIAKITITDSEVVAYGGPKAAGIGANFWCSTEISIADSKIEAYGGSSSAGIGTSRAGDNGVTAVIDISGSEIIAVGGDFGAGIGSGYNGDSVQNLPESTVEIIDSNINATGGMGSAAIGGGYKSGSVSINIEGGEVTATAGDPLAEELIYPGQEAYTTWLDRTPCAIGSGANGDHGTNSFATSESEVAVSSATVNVTAYENGKAAIEGIANDTLGDSYTGIKEPRKGTVTYCYTRDNGFWGEGGGNAENSLVVELYEGEKKIASSSLKDFENIIDGDVYVTWSIPFSGEDSDYWDVTWETGYPKYDMNPDKVVMVIDGEEVAVNLVQFNAPDNLNKIVALAEGFTGGVQAYTSLTEAMGNFNGRKVNVLRDVNESIDGFYGVTLTTNVEGGVKITDTNTEDWIDFDDVTVGKGVTVNIELPYSGDSDNLILGTLNAGETYYHGYDAKTTVKDGGRIYVSGTTILRYNENAEAGLYIYGDGDDSTVEFDCDYYIGAYSGTFYAEDANIETGYFLLKNSYDNDNYADINMTLDNSSLTVVGTTDTQDLFIIDDKAHLTLKNGSAIEDVRDFNVLAGTQMELIVDSTSSIGATNVSIAENVPLEAANNGDGTWNITPKKNTENEDGSEGKPYLIGSVADLLWLQAKVDEQLNDGTSQFAGKYFKMTADIDLAGINWNPIGSMSGDHGSFKGIFDGAGHTISNLTVEQAGNGLGLFARTAGNAEIKNLTLNNVKVKSTDNSNYVGAVVGNSYASTKITNVHVTGKIDISGRGYIGGISGHGYVVMDNVSVKGEGTISSTFWCAGGILGYGGEGATHISNAVVEGTGEAGLTITSAAGGLGAIVGMAEDNNGTQPISGENLSAKNVNIKTYTGAYGDAYANYALGYLYGGNPTSELTGTLTVEKVDIKTSTGEAPAVSDAVADVDGAIFFDFDAAMEAVSTGSNIRVFRDVTITGTVELQDAIFDATGKNVMNNGTILVSGESDIAANMTGDGWVYMNGVTMSEKTNLIGAKVRFASGTNTVDGSVIDDGYFQVGIGAYNGVDEKVDTTNGAIVNVKNAKIGSVDKAYAGWIGTGFYDTDNEKAAAMTDAKYVLNIEDSIAEFGYLHVSNDGELNVKGDAVEKAHYNNSEYSFRGGDFIINGVANFEDTDVLTMYTKVSCDNGTDKPGTLNIKDGTEYEAERHNGAIAGTNFVLYKTGVVNVDKNADLYIGEYSSVATNAVMNIGGTATALGTITNNGKINLTDLDAMLTTPSGPAITTTIDGATVIYETDTYKLDTITVTFDNEGTITTASAINGGKVVKPTDPTKEGYNFKGWYTDAECTVAFNFDTVVTQDITLYAKWAQKPSGGSGGSGGGGGSSAVTPEEPVVPTNPFKDVNEKDYFYNAVMWAVANGVTSGTSADTFSPDATCTRAQTVTFLWNAAGKPEPKAKDCPFVDVAPTAYYYKAILWAVEEGITAGTSATTFGPNETVTRGQNVTFLWKFADKPVVGDDSKFHDVTDANYYHDAVVWAAEEGITAGTSATTFGPEDPCTRGQIVTFLYRHMVEE